MALTDTKASKKFIAGAPEIILKGDYRPKKDMQMASDDTNERFLEHNILSSLPDAPPPP